MKQNIDNFRLHIELPAYRKQGFDKLNGVIH